jgi:plastocyanin
MFCLRCSAALTLMVAAGVLAGCKSDRPSPQADASAPPVESPKNSPNTVNVTAKDFGFDAPAKIPAGATRFEMANTGKEFHQAQLIRLEDGKTLQDLAKAMSKPGPTPSWVKFVGGPNGVGPGQNANATATLTPGQYAYLCLIPSTDGVMHLAKGMARPFEVTAASSAAAAESPAADVTIKLSDYDFQSSPALTPGRHTIRVENAGPQAHEIVMLKLAPGKKVEDFGRWAETGMKGPPPAEPLGGVSVLDKGDHGTFEVELTPGEYGFICFVPDSKDGKPHLFHGMMKTIKVG